MSQVNHFCKQNNGQWGNFPKIAILYSIVFSSLAYILVKISILGFILGMSGVLVLKEQKFHLANSNQNVSAIYNKSVLSCFSLKAGHFLCWLYLWINVCVIASNDIAAKTGKMSS